VLLKFQAVAIFSLLFAFCLCVVFAACGLQFGARKLSPYNFLPKGHLLFKANVVFFFVVVVVRVVFALNIQVIVSASRFMSIDNEVRHKVGNSFLFLPSQPFLCSLGRH